jgi:hypothetical protein
MEVQTTKLTAFMAGIIGLIMLPLGCMWAVNTVFAMNIEYTFLNWLSVVFLQLYLQIVIKASTINTNIKK